MAVWELAILILALTYGLVQVFSMVYMVKLMNKYDGIITRVLKLNQIISHQTYNSLFLFV